MPWHTRAVSEPSASQAEAPSAEPPSSMVPYAAPLFAYIALGALDAYLPRDGGQASPFWYPVAYSARLVIVGATAWFCRSAWKDLRPFPRAGAVLSAVVIGLLVWGLWVGLDGHYPPPPRFLGQRVAFDPTSLPPLARELFIGVRMVGLVFLVPLIEELFWRSFLIRWLIDQDFQRVPVGQVTPLSAAISSALFGLVHPEWLPALITGFLWAFLLWRTKSVSACVVSHITANLALGVYVIVTGDWKYW
jgi:uncharacterized protein